MRIMLVDDDPYSIEKLKNRIVQLSGKLEHAFEIVSECYSGQSALEQIPLVNPDAVFTDIQMSSVSGIELAKSIQQRHPGIPVVIFSAYPTFEYAREAIRANVVEYLLKPIDTAALEDVLQKLIYLNQNKVYMHTLDILRSVISREQDGDRADLIRPSEFPFPHYRVLLIQNVDAIYDTRLLMPKYETDFEPLRRELNRCLADKERAWFLPSDDGRFTLLILGTFNRLSPDLDRLLGDAQRFFTRDGVAPTIVYSDAFEDVLQLKSLVQRLFVALSERSVIGRPQLLFLESPFQEPASHFAEVHEKRILSALENADTAGLRSVILKLFENWEKNGCTSMIVEINLKRIVRLFENHYRMSNISKIKTLETRTEELIYTSRSFPELAETFLAMLASSFQLPSEDSSEKDAMQLFNKIEMYISSHIGQPLSLQLLTDHFHISRTVLCNLFRDYGGKSFVEYITSLRMKTAQQLMRDYPEMLNREIAEIIGYPDQNYFSRVFRTVTEMSPTQYRESLGKGG